MPTLLRHPSAAEKERPCASKDLSARLRSVPIFTALDDAAVEELCTLLTPAEFDAGKQLFHIGDAGDAMYLIEQGRVRISIIDADGRDVTLAELGAGDFFGEMAMIDGHGRSANAIVAEHAHLAVLTRENFLTFVSSDARVVLEMLSAITNRLRRTDELLRHRVSRNANEEDAKNLTLADRAADKLAQFGGSWKFIAFEIGLFLAWMAANTWLLAEKQFDPYPYVFLNLVLAIICGLQAPIILMSQNREAQKDRLRADLDYHVNLKNEMLLGEILRRLEKREFPPQHSAIRDSTGRQT
ncbi:MAG: cyclic nucleotide-binding protein [Verrucomicrobia bacterium]|nr:MAG: cyclic nucleotide-binding protein [Verrucomicrobiota bacterium]